MKKSGRLSMLYASVALTLLCSANLLAENQDKLTPDYKDFSSPREFVGIVTPLTVSPIVIGSNIGYRGIIYSTANPGQLFRGPMYDINGNVIRKGDVLAKMYPDFFIKQVKANEALVQQTKADLAFTEADYVRNAKLIKDHSVSTHDFQLSQSTYYKNKSALINAEALLDQMKIELAACKYHAQFDGMVNDVMVTAGLANEVKALELVQLFPIGVKIEMDRELANQIGSATPVTIYPDPAISNSPIGIVHESSILRDDGIIFETTNYPLEPKTMENGKEIPHVHSVYTIVPFDYDLTKCAISNHSIKKDEKGYYVWLAVGQKNMQTKKALDLVFSVKKVYVTLGDKAKRETPRDTFVLLKDPGELQMWDVVLGDVPDNLKDGDRVCLHNPRYLLMPGDKVRVIIGPNTQE